MTEATKPVAAAPESSGSKRWYVVHAYSGMEKSVAKTLQERVDRAGLQSQFGRIMVPTEEVVEVKGGKRAITERRLYSGYVLVEMDMTDEAWHLVKSTPKVTGFVGTGKEPTPLSQEEVDNILAQVVSAKEKPKPKYVFEKGEPVKIIEGPFSNFTGTVDEINLDRNTLKVMVTIFGRHTPVELDFLGVQKL